jgi:hypothetical protein
VVHFLRVSQEAITKHRHLNSNYIYYLHRPSHIPRRLQPHGFHCPDDNSYPIYLAEFLVILQSLFKIPNLPFWSSGHSSCLQIQRSRFDSRYHQIFREIVCLERGPLSLVRTTEERLGRKISYVGLEK